ncbi:transport protein particle component [Delitschia confertaspora ATCC 74209]|uniref:Transport protein particle component n=1 Tax=Delitschia confertaspora ATCC 74209 TaxID=1513339 RepID=A0A9P4MWI3_9PLEO|nr:transport protein particle component [Delitschia confertaspora ATCC 74209]
MASHPRPSTPSFVEPTAQSQVPLTDPTSTLLSSSCLDFLLIELVPMAYRITADLAAREEEWLRQDASKGDGRGSVAGGGTLTLDEEEAREAVFHRLEALGYRVGLGVVERFSRTHPRPQTPLDIIKFLCKDLWTLLFRKQIDNLKTNHRGIYVLTDNTFKPLSRMSFDIHPTNLTSATTTTTMANMKRPTTGLARAQPFLYFPAGVIRGSLAALGIQATVQAETSALPGATFQIRTVGAKA